MGEGGCCVQLIDGDGVFNVAGIEHFMNLVKLAECGLSYAVVSIMGPQSSGMSMGLLNFYCSTSTSPTLPPSSSSSTASSSPSSPSFLLLFLHLFLFFLSLPPSSSSTTSSSSFLFVFLHRPFLFSFFLFESPVIPVWCHDIGREQAANKPLLKTVFQVCFSCIYGIMYLNRKLIKILRLTSHYRAVPPKCRWSISTVDNRSREKKKEKPVPRVLLFPDFLVRSFYLTFSIINCLNSSALQEWVQLEEAAQHDIVPGFGKKVTAILDKCLAG
ncbi:hypothetical protein BHE74_00016684 [Ensete ventricosum]|nr:hypothetical protein BHE74_00016684 [Ensete ventricosum]